MLELFIHAAVLLVLFQLKHFLADFPLQTPAMLGKFNREGWLKPLAQHAYVHAIITLAIASFYLGLRGDVATIPYFTLTWGLALFDFLAHGTMDRIKASPDLLGRYKITEKYFWWALGLDQMWHHLTHYIIIGVLLYVVHFA